MQNRQNLIIEIIKNSDNINISNILKTLNKEIDKSISKITLNRDIEKLIEAKLIIKEGKGPAVKYSLSPYFELFKEIDRDKYFDIDPLKRDAKESFDFDVFDKLKLISLFRENILSNLMDYNLSYQNNIKKISESMLKKEFERLTIELSWKSSRIEGNTYNILETEFLIKEKRFAAGHTKKEAIMILNHKEALDYINNNRGEFKKLTVKKIEDIHFLLTTDLDIPRGIRSRRVGITGTKYIPLNYQDQIRNALEKLCEVINNEKNIFAKALILNMCIAYIQPFNDGNKRTSRLMGNAVLMANNYCPLSFRSVDELEYKKAIILFYEQNNINYFKQIFIEQFEFATKNYFLT